jgi:transcriptional regulator with XRE-family HTH domain
MTTRTPTGRRRRLGAELRRLREDAGLTIDRVAEALECSQSKVSRIETGQVSATPRDVRDMLELYRVSEAQREAMIQIAREARQRGWWQTFVDVPDGVPAYVGLEVAATSIDIYMSLIEPCSRRPTTPGR